MQSTERQYFLSESRTTPMIGQKYLCRLTIGKVILCIPVRSVNFLLFMKEIITFSSPAAFSDFHD